VNDEPTLIHTTELWIWVLILRTFCFQTRKPYTYGLKFFLMFFIPSVQTSRYCLLLGHDHFYILSMSIFNKNYFAFGVVLNEVKCLDSSFPWISFSAYWQIMERNFKVNFFNSHAQIEDNLPRNKSKWLIVWKRVRILSKRCPISMLAKDLSAFTNFNFISLSAFTRIFWQ